MQFFKKILKNICIVRNLETAFALFPRYSSFSFATLNGDFVSRDGVVEAGSAPRPDDSLFGRKQFLESLLVEFPKRESELTSIQNMISEKENLLDTIDLKVLSEQGRLLVNDLPMLKNNLHNLNLKRKKLKMK